MDEGLGRFGDLRREKGESFCTDVFWKLVSREFGSARWAAIGRARFELLVSCAIPR